ncbi:Stk1 family PASTA domain-containing Ser/Thr kinase [Jeotgalibacillus haloalkalitolerans]|uniref:non-specific serine/threonine protein kinase n=1 Tax=Jeotgalibacillus haloalkalitolerans TaxID=3104292 RepID=A0ABU5KK16_9BACL|nr:Stk1 family PASTA domain-containing Ser/Thr kinase [Jeotgalibacillus sp. HH7-29]MDZ5711607.1 Stk1 family PASTA domain-containing Ser/Thr kinase [Jeotgalibacillus sp. HH7-29]
MIGKRLSGRYKVLRSIGSGGMANVYLARDMILDRDVAVKVLRMDYVGDGNMLKRFQREAQSATSLTHPNIVSMYDVGDEEDYYFLVMEYVEGMTLKQYIQEQSPLALEDAIDIMLQLTSAIAHAHHNGIIHRDIKPQNILIDQEGNIKITDFGIAMALSATAITQTNSVMGTVHYLSPEQARGGTASKKSDIYSLGIVMYELITGTLPYEGETPISIALKHLQSDLPRPSEVVKDLPQSLENVILKAAAKDPHYRYSSADEMTDDLKTVLNPERASEPVFAPAPDLEATKAIPIIRDRMDVMTSDETKIHEPEKKDDKPVKKKKKKWPWILALIFILLLGGGLMAAMGMFGPAQIQVPDVTGENIEDAEEVITEAGLTVGDIVYEPNEQVEEDIVLRSSPKATRSVDEGERINLTVSSGKETIEVDGYVGRNFDNSEELIREAGFTDIEPEERYDDSAAGTILEQDPREGEEVVPGDTVMRLVISQGPEQSEVPDLTGYTAEEIAAYEQETGISVTITREEYSGEYAAGTVISQNPEAGTMVEVGGNINVVTSLGAPPVPVNNVVIPVTIEYLQEEEPPEEGEDPPELPEQVVTIYIEDKNNTMDEPVEEFTITEDTERNIRLTIEEGSSGSYRIERNGETYLEDTFPYEQEG